MTLFGPIDIQDFYENLEAWNFEVESLAIEEWKLKGLTTKMKLKSFDIKEIQKNFMKMADQYPSKANQYLI